MKCLALTAVLTLLACSVENTETSDLAAHGDHYDANHCELFIDKAVNYSTSHAYKSMFFYLKTLNNRLDGKPQRVGFRYIASDKSGYCERNPESGNCKHLGEWRELEAQPFYSDDYYSFSLFIGSDYNPSLRYKGAFFVITDKGTTYWMKNGEDQDFIIDYNTFHSLGTAYYSHGQSYTSYSSHDVSELMKTANFFTDLNPQACR